MRTTSTTAAGKQHTLGRETKVGRSYKCGFPRGKSTLKLLPTFVSRPKTEILPLGVFYEAEGYHQGFWDSCKPECNALYIRPEKDERHFLM